MAFLRSAAAFVAGFALAAAIAFAAFGAGRRGAGAADESRAESLATAVYLLGVTSVPAAAGFAAVTSASRKWRATPLRAAAPIAAACGFLCYAALLTGVASLVTVVMPFPLGALGAAVRLIVPGVVLGSVALAVSALCGRRKYISES